MAATAGLLLDLLIKNCMRDEYTSQQIYWSRMCDRNSVKLSKYTKYEEAWENAFDDYMDPSKTCKHDGVTYAIKDETERTECAAEQYANIVVEHRDNEILLECQELDIEYGTLKTTYDTLLTKLQEDINATKEQLSNAASDGGGLSSGS